MWKLNITVFKQLIGKEEITRKIVKEIEMNENENKTYQNF